MVHSEIRKVVSTEYVLILSEEEAGAVRNALCYYRDALHPPHPDLSVVFDIEAHLWSVSNDGR